MGQARRARAEVVNSLTRLCWEHKRNTEPNTPSYNFIAVMSCVQYPMYTVSVEC